MRELRVEIHRGPDKKISGYTVHHHMEATPTSKSMAFMDHQNHTQPFSAKEYDAMMDHVEDHLASVAGMGAKAEKEEKES